MSENLRQIANYLTQYNCQYLLAQDYHIIVVPIQGVNLKNLLLCISLKENGKYFKISAEKLLTLDNFRQREKLFETLLTLSWQQPIIWKYNPHEQEISASMEFPLEDNYLTESQFHTCFSEFIDVLDNIFMPKLIVDS